MPEIKRKRFFAVLVAEALCLLLLLPGCFKKEKEIYNCCGEDIVQTAAPAGEGLEFQSERLELEPGVYEVRVQTSLAESQNIAVEVKYDSGYHNSLHENAVIIFAGDDEMDFNFYVLDKIPSAYIECDFIGVDTEGLLQLSVLKTNRGNRALLFLAAVFFAILDFLTEFRRRILDGRVTRRQQVVFWTLTAGVLLAYFPYLTDYMISGTDTIFHVSRMAWLKETLEQGTSFPIRIQSHWNYDYGYAVSLFYGDLFLFIPAVLQLMGFSLLTASKMFVFIILAATAVIAYWSFFQCVRDEYAALFGSMIYLLSPYHLLNLYNRGALGEGLAAVFFPLILSGMFLLYTQETDKPCYKRYKWYLIIGLSALLNCHLLSTEMTIVMMLLVCLVFWRRTFRKRTFLQLAEAAGAVLLLNMWFWLPLVCMLESDIYHLQSIVKEPIQNSGVTLAGFFQLLANAGIAKKGGDSTGIWKNEPIQIGAGAVSLLLLYFLWRRKKPYDKECKALLAGIVLTLVLSSRYFPWDKIISIPVVGNLVSSLQFPSRWLLLSIVFVSLFAAFFYRQVTVAGGLYIKSALVVAGLISVGSAVYHVNNIVFESQPLYLYEAENMGTIGVGRGEYLLEETGLFARDIYYHDPVAEEGLEWSDYTQRGTRAKLFLNNPTGETLHVEIPLTGYKGYRLKASGQTNMVPRIAEEVGNHGDLKIAVPAGFQGEISVYYGGLPVFHVAETVSLVTLVFLVVLQFCHRRQIRYAHREQRGGGGKNEVQA